MPPLRRTSDDHPIVDYEAFCGIPDAAAQPASNPDEVTVQQMKEALEDSGLGIKVIDVREPDEHEIAHVEGVPLIPVECAPASLHGTGPQPAHYIHCKSGVRSLKALQFLREQGYKYLKSVRGGINAWSDEIDSGVARY
jgi:rhodanese-related sulfurtransferase